MIHARSDYNRIQDPAVNDPSLLSDGSTPIGDDEPVFLVRAKDQAFIDVVGAWIESHRKAGGSDQMIEAAAFHLGTALHWRSKHGTKVADAPAECLPSNY